MKPTKEHAVLLADHYRTNLDELMKCPIILKMVQEIPVSMYQAFIDQKMMTAVNSEYAKRGGNNAGSLGAVGWAISELLIEKTGG